MLSRPVRAAPGPDRRLLRILGRLSSRTWGVMAEAFRATNEQLEIGYVGSPSSELR